MKLSACPAGAAYIARRATTIFEGPMPKKQSDLPVITKTRDPANYVFTITHKGPKDVDDLPANIKIFPKKKNGLG